MRPLGVSQMIIPIQYLINTGQPTLYTIPVFINEGHWRIDRMFNMFNKLILELTSI